MIQHLQMAHSNGNEPLEMSKNKNKWKHDEKECTSTN